MNSKETAGMTDRQYSEILAAIQTDPGNRGLARVPDRNLFTAFPHDFAAACALLNRSASLRIVTGFYIPGATPPAFETDGPLGAVFLARALATLTIPCEIKAEPAVFNACSTVINSTTVPDPACVLFLERGGPSSDGRRYTMRGTDITNFLDDSLDIVPAGVPTLGIGDGGNEIGMGKIPHDIICANIPNGERIHCRVATDHLVVCGVSNWGAYALAAGLFLLRGVAPPAGLFDAEHERLILERMVRAGPLVDGVRGLPTATVDGLSWEDYTKPLVRIAEILSL
jgi:D-glutamate cyclase